MTGVVNMSNSSRSCTLMPNARAEGAPGATGTQQRVRCWALASSPCLERGILKRPQHRIHARLVARALRLEPLKHIGIDA